MSAAAGIGVVAFGWLVLFQVMLAAGVPLGRMAWGGASARLDWRKRLASLLVAAPIAGLGLVGCLQVAGVVSLLPEGWLRPMFWGLAGLFGVSLLGNAMSGSRAEQLHGVPLTLILSGVCAVCAWAL